MHEVKAQQFITIFKRILQYAIAIADLEQGSPQLRPAGQMRPSRPFHPARGDLLAYGEKYGNLLVTCLNQLIACKLC